MAPIGRIGAFVGRIRWENDEYYRQRTVLKVNVRPEDLAEAISFLVGPRASRTTGGVLTVDGGVTAAYVR